MKLHRFNVFGRIIGIQREGAEWVAYSIGCEGKRALAGFVIPEFIEEHQLERYLFDLFHENATSTNGEVRRIE